jgi:ribosome biogenesis GTPase
VGKSSLLRRLEPSLELEVGEVSEKLGRGRHTTRAVSLWPLRGGGYVADTPGFSSFDPERMELGGPAEIERAFPEFAAYREHCRFRDCLHVRAQDCAVHAAVRRGDIPQSRYASYVRLVNN